jgi:hypothetical protein
MFQVRMTRRRQSDSHHHQRLHGPLTHVPPSQPTGNALCASPPSTLAHPHLPLQAAKVKGSF